jgi:tetratricopeptide (TPR) repeat protein
VAQEKQKEAEDARKEEARQRQKADRQSERAQRGYRRSLDAFNAIVVGIQTKLERRPATQDLSLDLLAHSVRELRQLLGELERDGNPGSTLVWAHLRLGDVELILGDVQAALREYTTGYDLAMRLAKDDPRNSQAQRDLSVSYAKLGDVTLRLGKTDEALGFYNKGLEIDLKWSKDYPKNALVQRDLSVRYNKLGGVALKQDRTGDALDSYNKGLEVRLKLAKDDPRNSQAHTDLFVSYWYLGWGEKARHDYTKAADWFAKGRTVLLPWHQKKLLVGQFENAVALVDEQLASCKNAEKAVASLSFVLQQKPDLVAGLFDVRVRALLHRKKVAAAVKTADCWADWFDSQDKTRLSDRYNAARALALCAAQSEEKNALAYRAVALLGRLQEDGYFDDSKRLAYFHQDAGFAAVRGHTAFAEFTRALKR